MEHTIYLKEGELRKMVYEIVSSLIRNGSFGLLSEGMTIHPNTRTVSFDPASQDNVDTNDYLHPFVIKNNYAGCTVLSMFERKDNEEKIDGNPVIYALKGLYKWRFENPSRDIPILYRHFLAATSCLHREFDTMIMTPSSNKFNNFVFNRLKKYINCHNFLEHFFKKLDASTVEKFYTREDVLESLAVSNSVSVETMRQRLVAAFQRMEVENGGVFSYKLMPSINFRQVVGQSLQVSFEYETLERYRELINGKEVVVLDDTVTTGKTISDSAEAIREMFVPKNITFITVFSPRQKENVFPNERISSFS